MGKVATYGAKGNSVNDAFFFFLHRALYSHLHALLATLSFMCQGQLDLSLYAAPGCRERKHLCNSTACRDPRAPALAGIGIFEGT